MKPLWSFNSDVLDMLVPFEVVNDNYSQFFLLVDLHFSGRIAKKQLAEYSSWFAKINTQLLGLCCIDDHVILTGQW